MLATHWEIIEPTRRRLYLPRGVIFEPISSDVTRITALLTGEMDMVYPVPVRDVPRLESMAGVSALVRPGLRTIFLGLGQARDEL